MPNAAGSPQRWRDCPVSPYLRLRPISFSRVSPKQIGMYDGLKQRRILVKNVHSWHPLLANCLRITVGTPRENDALLAALTGLLPGR